MACMQLDRRPDPRKKNPLRKFIMRQHGLWFHEKIGDFVLNLIGIWAKPKRGFRVLHEIDSIPLLIYSLAIIRAKSTRGSMIFTNRGSNCVQINLRKKIFIILINPN
jgi:hypothetical protein